MFDGLVTSAPEVLDSIGFHRPSSWVWTFAAATAWLGLMLAYSPLADRLATKIASAAPRLASFRGLQQSMVKLIGGIVIAWLLGGFLEEIALRGFLLHRVVMALSGLLPGALSTSIAICVAALVAGVLHLYQGPRAALIVAQLSVLFGVLFAVTRQNLWCVVLCHGMFDTVAFVRFGLRKSRYSNLEST